ncbi:MAG: group II truncated hemoglobin [Phycisphaerales bacterium]
MRYHLRTLPEQQNPNKTFLTRIDQISYRVLPTMTNQPPSNPPQPQYGPGHTPYDTIGGDEAVRALVDAFYNRIRDDSPVLRDMHPPDDRESREKLHEFLSGWLGGPQLYIEKRGHPRLRMRHMPFPVDQHAVDEWLKCMHAAMDDCSVEEPLRSFLSERFTHTANFMRNR